MGSPSRTIADITAGSNRAPHGEVVVSLWMLRPVILQPHFLHLLVLDPSVTKILGGNLFRLFSPTFAASRGLRKNAPSSKLDFSHHQLLFPMPWLLKVKSMVPCLLL